MKKAMKLLFAMAVVLMMSSGALAQTAFNAQGSTHVPGLMWYTKSTIYDWTYSLIIVNNITNQNIKCKVTAFNDEGVDISSALSVAKGGSANTWTGVSSSSGEFDLPAYASRMVFIRQGATIYALGHAKIEWNSSDPQLSKALMAGGVLLSSLSGTGMAGLSKFEINNGQPF